MPRVKDRFATPADLVLGTRLNARVPAPDQERQRAEVAEILKRLRTQPGVVLADEVGMGKTFVGLSVAYSVAEANPRGPVILMVPPNLVEKWEQDLVTFCELYLDGRVPVRRDQATPEQLKDPAVLLYGTARHSVELMRLLDDPRRERSRLIFMAQGAMGRRQTDKWVRLALIAETLRRHVRRGGGRLIGVKRNIHRYLADLLRARVAERVNDLGEELWTLLLREHPSYWKDTYNGAVHNEDKWLRDDPVPKAVFRALDDADLRPLADALMEMPINASRSAKRLKERIDHAREALREAEEDLWKELLAQARWRSPLLIMDEAHHLKNPGTRLARTLQSPDSDKDLRTGDGAMARAFDRMLFLTATPFQLGHHELVRVLERFGDVRWATDELGDRSAFLDKLRKLEHDLDESQRTCDSAPAGVEQARARNGRGQS